LQSNIGRKFVHFYKKIQLNALFNRAERQMVQGSGYASNAGKQGLREARSRLLVQGSGLEGTKTLGRRLALRPPVATNSPF
jgi:hypothetical protein